MSIQTVAFWFITLHSFKCTCWYHTSYWCIQGCLLSPSHNSEWPSAYVMGPLFLSQTLWSWDPKSLYLPIRLQSVTTHKITIWITMFAAFASSFAATCTSNYTVRWTALFKITVLPYFAPAINAYQTSDS